MKGFPDLPPIWLLGALALCWALAQVFPLVRFGSFPGVSMVLWVVACAIVAWSAIWFRRKRTTIEPHHDPSALIKEGPFRLSRNPIYLAMVIIAWGAVAWWGAASAIVVPVVLAWILSRRFIAPEEAALRRAFGPEAETYFTATRRWV